MTEIDAIEFTRGLIQRQSITPTDDGALDLVGGALNYLGFQCERLKFEDVDNLFARIGAGKPHFCFAGHTDVVPAGDEAGWEAPPFQAALKNGEILGRGAADMKSAIAAFIVATARSIEKGAITGTLSFLITGDEEGPAVNGTKKVLQWMHKHGHEIDHCLVGEPTNPETMGEMMKVGRRGSINCWLTISGAQGHVAYPDRAENPIPALMRKLLFLSETPLDEGYERFQPSSLQVTDIHIGNPAHNVIPEKATARFNIRFNPTWTGVSIEQWLRAKLDELAATSGAKYDLVAVVSGEAFLTTDTGFIGLIADAVKSKSGRRPEFSTSGGTSDARFIKDYAPVVEFGLVGATMHQTNERAAVSDIHLLTDIYEDIIARYFQHYGASI